MKIINLLFCLLVAFNSNSQKISQIDINNDSSFNDLFMLDSLGESNRLFFSGENHMYQKSNLKLELKLLKYFHKKHGVKNLLLEFGGGTSWITNEYIKNNNNKKFEKAISNSFSENYITFFKEIKKYNDSMPSDNKIKIIGIDIQRFPGISFEALGTLIPDSTLAPDSISKEIDLIKFMNGYNQRNNITYSIDLSYGYKRRERFNNRKSLKIILDNFKNHKEKYKEYLGSNFKQFDVLINIFNTSENYYNHDSKKTPYGILYREDYMFKKMNKIAEDNPNEKFYGQFGRAHTYKNRNTNDYAYNFSSLVSKINTDKACELHNKVFSIGIYYIDLNNRGDYQGYETREALQEKLKDLPKDYIGILKIKKNSKIDSVLDRNYNYIIVHNGSLKNESNLDWNSHYEETTSLNGFYGITFLDFGEIETLLGMDKVPSPIDYWGISLTQIEGFGHIDYSLAFYLPKTLFINDTTNATLKGFNGFITAGGDFIESNKLDIIPSVGFGYQRFNIYIDNVTTLPFAATSVKTAYKISNSSFMFDFGLETRVRLNSISKLSLKGSYRVGISNKNWKYEKSELQTKTNQSGMYYQVGINFGFFD